jgi:hypothetical protein
LSGASSAIGAKMVAIRKVHDCIEANRKVMTPDELESF